MGSHVWGRKRKRKIRASGLIASSIRWGSKFLAVGEGLRVNPWTSCCGRAQERQVKALL